MSLSRSSYWSVALEGRRRLYARGRFLQGASASDLIAISEEIARLLKTFIEDHYDLDSNHHEKKSDVFYCWRKWARTQNLPFVHEPQFSRNLNAAFSGKIKPTRLRDEEDRTQAYQGIKRKKIDPYRRFCETQLIEEANAKTPEG